MKAKAVGAASLLFFVSTVLAGASGPNAPIYSLLYGDGRNLQLFLQRDSAQGQFFVRRDRIRLALRALDVPVRTLLLGTTSPSTIGSTPGEPCPGPLFSGSKCFQGRSIVEITFLLPPGLKAGGYAVRLRDLGAAYENGAAGLSVSAQVSPALLYVPQTSDAGLRAVRARYLGKTVYAMPNVVEGEFHCKGDPNRIEGLRNYQTATIASVERSFESAEAGHFQNPDPAFIAIDPLVVTITTAEPPKRSWPPGAGPVPVGLGNPPAGACTQRTLFVADLWEMERRFALHDPRDHPEWPVGFRRALAQQKILPGMTHEMVASALGYPAHYGTIEQLDRLPRWEYDAPTPFSSSVLFRGDSVVKFNPPGNLP